MLIDNVRTTTIDSAITMREDRRDGWSEIAVYVIKPDASWYSKKCISVITHPCAGAKWFLYDGNHHIRFRTRKEAIKYAVERAKHSTEYKTAMEARRANQH